MHVPSPAWAGQLTDRWTAATSNRQAMSRRCSAGRMDSFFKPAPGSSPKGPPKRKAPEPKGKGAKGKGKEPASKKAKPAAGSKAKK